MTDTLRLSPLPHTWIFDVDGTILRHNGHKAGGDEVLPGVHAFWAQIPAGDTIVLMTARKAQEAAALERVLAAEGLRYDRILYDLPVGERVLVNDRKPSGLATSHAVNCTRDAGLAGMVLEIDPEL